MSEAIHPLPQYAFMAWCLVKSTGTTLLLLVSSFQFSNRNCVCISHFFHSCCMTRASDQFIGLGAVTKPGAVS
jgi:hypothetical protein